MASAGRILIMPKGNYNADTTYESLDLVYHNGSSWVAKKTVKGVEPTTGATENWQQMSDFSSLEERKQERIVQSVTVMAGSSYELTLAEKECCLLCAYLGDPMYYSGIFACCGINAWSYSIVKLNESLQGGGLFTAQIADDDGTNANKIIFKNETGSNATLNLIKIPLNV